MPESLEYDGLGLIRAGHLDLFKCFGPRFVPSYAKLGVPRGCGNFVVTQYTGLIIRR